MFIVLKLKSIVFSLCIAALALIILCVQFRSTVQVSSELVEHQYKVYLTLDDGPSQVTEKVLDVLKSNEVKATFFVIGQSDEYGISLYHRIISEGHSLGLHSYTHNMSKIYASATNYIEDFERLRDWIVESTGTLPKLCRMVGGSCSRLCSNDTKEQIMDYFSDNNYACYDWDIDPRDSGSYALAADAIAKRIINDAKKKPNQDLVILLHDDNMRKTLPDALAIIIPYFKEQGYLFDTLSDDTILNNSRSLINKE